MKLPTSKQVFIGIWFHDKMFPEDEQAKMKWRLNRTFYYSRVFDEMKQLTTYIEEKPLVAKVFLIISTAIDYSSILNITSKRPKVFRRIYVFLPPYLTTVTSTPEKKVFTDMIDLFQELSADIINYLPDNNRPENNSNNVEKQFLTPMSTIHSKCVKDTHIHDLNKETLQFLCFLAMTNILLKMSFDESELTNMLTLCRDRYMENNAQLDHIDDFPMNYESSHAINYYTANKFLFRMVNEAFANESIKEIFVFGVYVTDLHRQLCELYENNQPGNVTYPIIVHRGKMLTGSVLQQLIDNSGSFISMNGFLSTTADIDVAIMYAGNENDRKDYNSVLFELHVNESMERPFANISHLSDIPWEDEVLFSVGTIWEIQSVQLIENRWKVQLKSCGPLDSHLTDIVEKYAGNHCNFHSLGDLLYKVGNDDDAEFFYTKILEQGCLSNECQAILLHQIGMMRFRNGDYTIAIKFMNEVLEKLKSKESDETESTSCRPLYVPFGLPSPRTIYHNVGLMHQGNKEFSKASSYYKQALIEKGSEPELAAVHNSIGLLCLRQGTYESAVNHHTEAINIIGENHPWLPEFKCNLERAQKRHQYVLTRQQPTTG